MKTIESRTSIFPKCNFHTSSIWIEVDILFQTDYELPVDYFQNYIEYILHVTKYWKGIYAEL